MRIAMLKKLRVRNKLIKKSRFPIEWRVPAHENIVLVLTIPDI